MYLITQKSDKPRKATQLNNLLRVSMYDFMICPLVLVHLIDHPQIIFVIYSFDKPYIAWRAETLTC